ncbi:hypothetical protein [Mariniflexile sp.]|uniref:hypothetical protein n=1 Tax=Mariniflexile sp. TaxID=1979402 RepID=UPI0040473530
MKKTIVGRHKVGNFDVWLKGHQDRVELFAPAVSSFRTFQDTNDPNSVVVVFEDADVEMLGAIINDPKNQAIKDKHTVLEPVILSMQVA